MFKSTIKLNNKIILGFVLIILLTVVVVFQVFFRSSSNLPTERQKIFLNNYTTQRYGRDFTIANDIDIKSSENNKSYKAIGLNKYYENIKTGALKLGLSNEESNQTTGITQWSKVGSNNIYSEYVYLDRAEGYVRVTYANGMNSDALGSDNYISFINDFFGLPNHEVAILSNQRIDSYTNINYSVKIQGREVYFGDGDNVYLNIGIVDGKIVKVFFYILPEEFTEYLELDPITKVNKDNIQTYYYKVKLQLENASGRSDLGVEYSVATPANIGFRGQTEGYSLFYDTNQGWLLLPIVVIDGVFTDASSQRGKSYLLVVNQAP